MKVRYEGTGTVSVPGAGEVDHGGTIEVPDDVGRALTKENPRDWEAADKATPRTTRRAGGD